MNNSPAAVFALVLSATSLSAQTRPPALAFPRSATAALGLASFDTRSSDAGGAYSYKGSLLISGKFDMSLTRRTGLLLGAGIAPLSQQRYHSKVNTQLGDKLFVGILDAALGFRFKPTAPVFFSGGAGVTYATRSPVLEATGAMMEPHALFAIGFDAKTNDAWNIRTVFSNRFVKPKEDDNAATLSESVAYDWVFEVGARYTFPRK